MSPGDISAVIIPDPLSRARAEVDSKRAVKGYTIGFLEGVGVMTGTRPPPVIVDPTGKFLNTHTFTPRGTPPVVPGVPGESGVMIVV